MLVFLLQKFWGEKNESYDDMDLEEASSSTK